MSAALVLERRSVDADVVAAVSASMLDLPRRYRASRAPYMPRRYRIHVTGCPTWTVSVDGDRCVVWPSTAGNAHADLHTDPASWLDLVSGHRNGLELFFLGLLEVHGDLNEALRLETLFTPPAGSPAAVGHAEIVRYRIDAALAKRNALPVPGGRPLCIETFQAGDPAAPVALLLHGLGASKVSLLPTIAGLAETHRVIAMDFPGFGKSSAPVGAPYDAAWFSNVALATLDAAGVDRAVLVGNSMGGRVALDVALAAPDRVRALGLLCPAVAFEEYHHIRPLINLVRFDLPTGAAPWPLGNRMTK